MADILFVTDKMTFLVTSLIKLIEENGDSVIRVACNPSDIRRQKDDYRIIVLYAEEYNVEGLVYLKDIVFETERPIIVLGTEDEIEAVEGVLPSHYIKKTFLRPFHVKEVAEDIGKFVKRDMTHLKKKILVVDDSGAVLRSVKSWLEDTYQVILANSGAMAIKYLATEKPDLILLDYEMPICDGRQVLEMIRAEAEFGDIPVIFLTNKNDRDSVLNVSKLGVDGYLLKTMEPTQIIEAIDDFFLKRRWDL